MKHLLLLTSVVITILPALLAQSVGINNPTPAASAILDVTSTDKGLLTPRMSTAQRLAIPTPASGLVVYDNSTNQFFYFNSTAWVAFSASGLAWNITGNAGTDPLVNFIGTTDNQPLIFRVANTHAGAIDPFLTSVYFGKNSGIVNTGYENAFFGHEAGLNNSSGNSNAFFGAEAGRNNTTGIGNSLFGWAAGHNSSTTTYNSFFGYRAGEFNDGSFNSFFGAGSGAATLNSSNSFFGALTGPFNVSGGNNTFIGHTAGHNTVSGSNNTFVGQAAGYYNTGEKNTALGYQADITPGLINATAIGAHSKVEVSNALVLGSVGSSATPDINVGIGTTTPGWPMPNVKLTVIGPAAGTGPTIYAGGGGDVVLGNGGSLFFGDNYNYSGTYISRTTPADNIIFHTDGWERMRLEQGWLGIGTGTPVSTLHVEGTITMRDGSEGVNRVLVSNAGGSGFWTTLTPALTNAWSLTGNSGTSSASNFIGTIDNLPLRFRVNNITAGAINQILFSVYFGQYSGAVNTGTKNSFYGNESGKNNSSGFSNSFFGSGAGSSNTTAGDNSFFGQKSGEINTANLNSFFGSATGALNTTGNINSFFGAGAGGANNTGSSNTFIGRNAGIINTSGSNNTSIGANSNFNSANLTNVTAIGANARADVSNTLILGSISGNNGATSGVRVGIGTTTPQKLLHVGNATGDAIQIGSIETIEDGGNNALHTNSSFRPTTDNARALGSTTLRWSTVFAATGTINTSDRNEKTNIRNLSYGLTEIMKMNPVIFQWKNNPEDGNKIGLIAQELQDVIPEVVMDWEWEDNEDGTRKKIPAGKLGVYYADVIPVIIKGMQEQQNIIDELQKKIIELEKKLEGN
jgi:trimeric autotransporter adhesin